MSAFSTRAYFEPLRSIAYGDVSDSYAAIGNPLANPARQLTITNATDVDVTISFDGVNDHLYVPSKTSFLNDLGSNCSEQGGFLDIAANTTVYVATAGSPSLGAVYVASLYVGLSPNL